MTAVLVGGVAELYQGDLDAGRVAVERLSGERIGPDVLVEDLSYGGLAVMQRLEDLRPEALVLVGAVVRGREPATVERRRIHDPGRSAEEVQTAVSGSITGYVGIDLIVDVAAGFQALPARTVAIEVEPMRIEPSTSLTPEVEVALGQALGMVREEVRRAPVLRLADELREMLADGRLSRSEGRSVLDRLLDTLATADENGEWGPAFDLRDRLRDAIGAGKEPEGMNALDWSLWWALIEALDGLQPPEARLSSEVSSNGGSSSSPRC